MRKLLITLTVVIALCLTTNSALAADPGSDAATCAISVDVNQIIEWEGGNFAAIALDKINAQGDDPNDSAVYTLWTNCDVGLSANTEAAAQLSSATSDTLVTSYKMATDANGVSGTGATASAVSTSGSDSYVVHSSFLSTALAVTHVNGDGAVEVTLYAKAENDSDNVADAGAYSATQTITAAWTSD